MHCRISVNGLSLLLLSRVVFYAACIHVAHKYYSNHIVTLDKLCWMPMKWNKEHGWACYNKIILISFSFSPRLLLPKSQSYDLLRFSINNYNIPFFFVSRDLQQIYFLPKWLLSNLWYNLFEKNVSIYIHLLCFMIMFYWQGCSASFEETREKLYNIGSSSSF